VYERRSFTTHTESAYGPDSDEVDQGGISPALAVAIRETQSVLTFSYKSVSLVFVRLLLGSWRG